MRCVPGTSGIGACSTSSTASVDATNVMYTGSATIATPRSSTMVREDGEPGPVLDHVGSCCDLISTGPSARRSGTARSVSAITIDHQHHRLRRRAAEVEALEAVVVHLEHEDLGGLRRAAAGRCVDDRERVEERVDDVDDEQEERRRRQEREHDRHEALHRTRAVDGRGLDQRLRNRLQARRGRTGSCS